MSRRAMLIGIDGATFDLIKPWADEGKLPHFKRWLDEGAYGTLHSTVHPFTPQAWTTMFTGMNAGRHGVFDFSTLDISKPYQPFVSRPIGCKRIWEILSEREQPVIVINPIGSYPPKPINGVIVSGRMTPPGESYTWPPEIAQEIADHVGNYKIDLDVNQAPHLTNASEMELLDYLLEMARTRVTTTVYLAEKYPWSLLLVVFMATDIVQHYYWRYLDPQHPDYTEKAPVAVKDAVLRVYQELDRGLALLDKFLDEETTAFIVSDHGFGPLYGQVNLLHWLIQENYLTTDSGDGAKQQHSAMLKIRQTLRDSIPKSVRRYLRDRGFSGKGLPALHKTMGIDWRKTRAYLLGEFGNLCINLKGREPEGIVNPGEEYEQLCARLVDDLQQLHNPVTGKRLIKRVYRREDLFEGPFTHYAPDLMIHWEDYAYTYYTPCDPEGPLVVPPAKRHFHQLFWSGMHRLDGVLMCRGANVVPVKDAPVAYLQDVTPTILHSLVQPLTEDMEGQARKDLIQGPDIMASGFSQNNKLEQNTDMSAEAVNAIQDRLRNLGYLEDN